MIFRICLDDFHQGFLAEILFSSGIDGIFQPHPVSNLFVRESVAIECKHCLAILCQKGE